MPFDSNLLEDISVLDALSVVSFTAAGDTGECLLHKQEVRAPKIEFIKFKATQIFCVHACTYAHRL